MKVHSIDAIYWKEIKEKHGKGPLEQVDLTSAIVEIGNKFYLRFHFIMKDKCRVKEKEINASGNSDTESANGYHEIP